MWGKRILWGCIAIIAIACFLLFNISAIASLLASLISVLSRLLIYIIVIVTGCFVIGTLICRLIIWLKR